MRILHITSYQGPDVVETRGIARNRHIGGSRKVELVSQMLERAGHEDVILSAGITAQRSGRYFQSFQSRTACKSDGARVIYSAGWDRRVANHVVAAISSMKQVAREVRAKGPFDILLPCNVDEYTTLMTWWYLTTYGRLPVVLQYEDGVETTGRGTGNLRVGLWRLLERWFVSHVNGVIAVSPSVADRIRHPNTLVLRGVVSESLQEASERRRPPFADGAPLVALYAGSLTQEKGVHRIIETANRFRGRIRFVICGTGEMATSLREQAARVSAPVEFKGFTSQDELERMMTSADLLLNPHDDEASGGILPFKLVEYLAAGGIVVTTRSGVGVDDPVLRYCEVVDPECFGDGIQRVLDHRDEAARRALSGRRWSLNTYSQRSAGRELNELLISATESRCTS